MAEKARDADTLEVATDQRRMAETARELVVALPKGVTVTVSRTFTVHVRTVTDSVTVSTVA